MDQSSISPYPDLLLQESRQFRLSPMALLLLGWVGDRRRCGRWDPGFWSSVVVVGRRRSARDVEFVWVAQEASTLAGHQLSQ
jgi:hypothetical protein